jgi:Tol biopolymer transport system component/DNA-binding winged helix-turn-helix (wHTH) protein
MSLQTKHIYEFGLFRLDAAEHLLLRAGETVPLTPKAFDLLLTLVERHGRLLEKDELLKLVWPDTVVEEANLATNISLLRKALGEGENGQRYIETAPKRGYRFIATVKKVEDERAELAIQEKPGSQSIVAKGEQAATAGELIPPHPVVKTESLKSKVKGYQRGALIALATLILSGVGFAYFVLRSPLPPKVTASVQLTNDGLPKTNPWDSLVTDGSRLYFSKRLRDQWMIAQISVTGGETVEIPAIPRIMDLFTSRTELLLKSGIDTDFESLLWVLPVLGGAPRRVGNVMGHAATWSLDGQQIVYANGSSLYLTTRDGTDSRKLVTVAGRPDWPRWSPDGSRLRFTVADNSLRSQTSLWEVAADGSNPHPLLPGWNNPAAECCGNWTADGRYFVFRSTRNRTSDIWVMSEQADLFWRANRAPVQLTFGPLNYYAPVPSLDGKKLFVLGEQQRGELARYDMKTRQWSSYLSGISAEHLDFSKDGERAVYVTYPEGSLWWIKVDGGQRFQLTYPPMQASLPRWSPDGKQIVFTGRVLGNPWKTYLISAEGGRPQQLTQGDHRELDPGWSPDGKTLVFGDRDTKTIHLLDLNTLRVEKLPGSEGLVSPRWSPDGRYITAVVFGMYGKLLLFDLTTQKWLELTQQPAFWQRWSRDGKYIYFTGSRENEQGLLRVRIGDRKIEWLASIKDFRVANGVWGGWTGWAPDDSPLMLRDVGIQDIYALEWQAQ